MTDLFAIFSKLVTPSGEILVPGIKDLVAPLTPEERCVEWHSTAMAEARPSNRKRYEVMDFSVQDIESAVGGKVCPRVGSHMSADVTADAPRSH